MIVRSAGRRRRPEHRICADAGGAQVPVITQDDGGAWGRKACTILVGMCLLGFGANAFGLYYLFLFIALVLLILSSPRRIGNIPVASNFIMLVLFSTTYSVPISGSLRQSVLNFVFPVAYLVGLIAVRTGLERFVQFRRVILTVVAGTTLHGVLNAATNIWSYGWTSGARTLPDFWTQAPLTATLQATLFIPLVGVAYYALAMRQEHRLMVAVIAGSGLIVCVAYNLLMASRTIFLVGALTFFACTLVSPWRYSRILQMTGIGLASIVLYRFDVFNVRTLMETSALMDRLSSGEAPGLGEDPRFERWAYVVEHFWDHTAGGLHFRAEIGYVHNLWLDAYDVAGFWALLTLLGFTIGALALLRRTLVLREVPVELKVLVVGLWVAFLAQFMTEPILDGMPTLFAVFCVFCGAVDGLVRGLPLTKASSRPSRIAK